MQDDMIFTAKNDVLSDEVKASVMSSGVLANLKNVTNANPPQLHDENLQILQQQVQAAIEDIAQKLNSGKLDDSTSVKLSTLMSKLQGASNKSPSALAAALSEAIAAMGDSGSGAGMYAQQKAEQLWKKVEVDNKDIDDDFTKMQKAGIIFNQSLFDKHKELMEYLDTHRHDITKQKELDAVDDAMLMQAKPQLEQCPAAQQSYDDAKAKSDDRHQTVDKTLAQLEMKRSDINSNIDADWNAPAKSATSSALSMNDVQSQSVGVMAKNTGKTQSM